MKIGIMTFWWSNDNYGQLLQCYALQKYLRDAGHDAYLIRYDSRKDQGRYLLSRILMIFNPVKLLAYIKVKIKKYLSKREQLKYNREFEDFRNKHICCSERIYYSYKELKKNPPDADIYISGSDQIWSLRNNSSIQAYFLDFGDPNIKRISYAASFGNDKPDKNFIQRITPLLQNFNYVSVREKSGLAVCKQCGIDNAEWVLDPTILLDIDKYRYLYKDKTIIQPDKPYCFLYILGFESKFSIQNIYDWAKQKKLEVIYITGSSQHDKYEKYYATIPEWIYLLEHAEYVITNSYHCSVFSILFQKQFAVIPLAKKLINKNTRLDSLFELFETESRFIDVNISVIDIEINWERVSAIIQNLKNACKLNNVISMKESGK